MKVVVIGAGLGGLLSAARLSKEGHTVEVFERLPITGGRFTNLEYKGFQLSSGAFHMLPHGPGGPLARLLKEMGDDVRIVRSEKTMIRIPLKKGDTDYRQGFRDIPFHDFQKPLSNKDRLKSAYLIVSTRKDPPKGSTLQEWIRSQVKDEWLVKLADSFCGWSLSMRSDEIYVEEVFEIFENLYRFGGPGVPMGGCKGIIDALEKVIMANGGTIHTKSEVSKILVENGNTAGVVVDGTEHKADLVISNTGHAATAGLCSEILSEEKHAEYLRTLETLRPSAGIKICLSAEEPLIGHSGVLLTPYARRVNGINEVTQVDPSLAPPGKHLTMSHQHVAPENVGKLEEEIDMGIQDLKEIFPGKKYEVLLIQSYHDGWPVNRASSGTDPGNETPIPGLYVVGDGAKGEGGIEVEGIALGVSRTMNKILG
jgi:phytoene dehydrogenase-like protein